MDPPPTQSHPLNSPLLLFSFVNPRRCERQIIKGAEPLFTATLSFLTGSAMPWPIYLTLLPVMGGVAMASVGEISFSLLAFAAAMMSNASAASRSVLGKKFLAKVDKVMSSLHAFLVTPVYRRITFA